MPASEEAFSAKLGLVMDALNLSRVAMAHELGVDKTVVGRWLSGVNQPTEHNLTRLTEIVRRRHPGFTLALWRGQTEAIAGALGIAAPAPLRNGAPPPVAAGNGLGGQDGRAADLAQEMKFCVSSDGVQLAYSRIGAGPPLVKTGNWLTHLEFDLGSPIWGHLYRELARDHTLVRYDARGNGLSDRDVEAVSFESFVRDLEAVVDAAGLDCFDLLGISQGCAVSVAYAVRHPDRVRRLVLYGGFAVGRRKRVLSEAEKQTGEAMLTLVRVGWGRENAAFRQIFTSQFVPGGTKEQTDWFNELQRVSTSPEDAVRNLLAHSETDVVALLGQVSVPTLVMHAREDARVPFDQGRRMAAGIPGARFVPLESRNHLFLEHEPAFTRFLQETRAFLGN